MILLAMERGRGLTSSDAESRDGGYNEGLGEHGDGYDVSITSRNVSWAQLV